MSACCFLPVLFFISVLFDSHHNYGLQFPTVVNLCDIGEVAFLEEKSGRKRMCVTDSDCPIGYYCNQRNGICCGEPGECPNGFKIAVDSKGYIIECSLPEYAECPWDSMCYPSTTVSQHLCCFRENPYRCPGKAVPYPNVYHPLKCLVHSSPNSCPSSSHCMPSTKGDEGICCTVQRYQRIKNSCPSGWISFGKVLKHCNPVAQTSCGGMSSCLPSVHAPQQFICCIPVSITNNIFGSSATIPLTCSNTQLSPEILASGQPRLCSLINPICSAGYVCQPSAQSSQMICCTAATSAAYSCPLSTQAPVLSAANNVFCSSPGTVSTCPSGATCQLASQQAAIFICCYGASVAVPQCPAGTTNQQGPLGYVVCDITSTVQQCQAGYLCTKAVNDNSKAICCTSQNSITALCPTQQRLYMSNGSPRYCSPNIPLSCPEGYLCTAATNLAGVYICCSVSTSNGCPNNFSPSISSTGSEIFCTPTDSSSCPSGAVCLESQIAPGTGQYLCCRSLQAPRVCPNNQNAYIGEDGQVERCTGPGAPCSEVGFTCQYSSTLGSWVCCGQSRSKVLCADGRDVYYQVEGQTYLCMPSKVPTGCPSYYDCAPSTVSDIYVCCKQQLPVVSTVPAIVANPSCPTGWNPYRNELDGSNRYCQNAIDMNCPVGFSCTQSTQQGLYLCCRLATSLRCASGQTTLLVNNQPRLCHNLRRNACPSGYSCRLSNMVNVYICCANFHLSEHAVPSFFENIYCLDDALFPTEKMSKIQYCETSADCSFGYICSSLTQSGAAVCCKKKKSFSKLPAAESLFPVCAEVNVPPKIDERSLECLNSNNECPAGYNCRLPLSDNKVYCCKNLMCNSGTLGQSLESCIASMSCNYICQSTKYEERSETPVCCSVPKNYDRCLGRETLLLSEVPVQCSAKSACPNGYVCSNHTTNMQFMCCKQYDPLKQICPENREPYRQYADGSLLFCDENEPHCPDNFICKQSIVSNNHVCCSPIASCTSDSVALIDQITNSPKRCFPDSDTDYFKCPKNYKCTTSTVKFISVCCQKLSHEPEVSYEKSDAQDHNSGWYILEDTDK